MKTCFYFGENGGDFPGGAELVPGYGFTAAGLWRGVALPRPGPGTAGLMADDRNVPSVRGAEAAAAALGDWTGLVVLDFERPPGPGAVRLVRALAGKRLVVPPALAALPHEAVLAGPWSGTGSFSRWLAALKERYGALVLDGAPLRSRTCPGGVPEPWTGPLPEGGFPCPGAGCLHRRLADGSVLLWDTKETLAARSKAAGVPVIVFMQDWEALA